MLLRLLALDRNVHFTETNEGKRMKRDEGKEREEMREGGRCVRDGQLRSKHTKKYTFYVILLAFVIAASF